VFLHDEQEAVVNIETRIASFLEEDVNWGLMTEVEGNTKINFSQSHDTWGVVEALQV
jgi:hypothetical protein